MRMMNAFPSYSEYKGSGIEWIGDIPSHWELQPIRAIYEERKESNKGSKTENILSVMKDIGVIPYDEKGDVGNKKSEDIERYNIVHPGDLVLNKMNVIIGSLGISDFYGALSPVYIILFPRNPRRNDRRYLGYLFKVPTFFKGLRRIASGILEIRESINRNEFKKLNLPLPPLKEQQRIADFLDQKTAGIDEAIVKKQQLIELMEERKNILINQAVTKGHNPDVPMKDSGVDWIGEIPEHWDVKKIKYATKIFRGKFTHRPRNDPKLYGGKYPFIQTGDVACAQKVINEFSQTLNDRGLRVSMLIPMGTVVITIAANIGDIAILGFDACFPDSIIGFKPEGEVDRDFLFYVLSAMKEQFKSSTTINTQMNLNVERVGSNIITIPPIKEQSKIVKFLDLLSEEFQNAINKLHEQIELLKEYKNIIISDAVTGKIKIQG